MIDIVIAEEPDDVTEVAWLFREYEAWHTDKQCFVGFDKELALLPRPYVMPDGVLLLAKVGEEGRAAGCIALSRLDDERCEMRRLYVRPAFRGQGVGRALVMAVAANAGTLGYRALRLQTLPTMEEARGLYNSMGFAPIAAPSDTYAPGRLHLELPLPAAPADEADLRVIA